MPTTRPITCGAFVPQGWKTELIDIDGPEAKWSKAVEIAELAEALTRFAEEVVPDFR